MIRILSPVVLCATAVAQLTPTALTLGNALCGLGAISLASSALNQEAFEANLSNAGLLIFLGMLFDMLDGRVAVWTKQTSEFGKQLDSGGICTSATTTSP